MLASVKRVHVQQMRYRSDGVESGTKCCVLITYSACRKVGQVLTGRKTSIDSGDSKHSELHLENGVYPCSVGDSSKVGCIAQ